MESFEISSIRRAGTVDQLVEGGIGDAAAAEVLMPVGHWQLRQNHRSSAPTCDH
jgi:hypothetical protein